MAEGLAAAGPPAELPPGRCRRCGCRRGPGAALRAASSRSGPRGGVAAPAAVSVTSRRGGAELRAVTSPRCRRAALPGAVGSVRRHRAVPASGGGPAGLIPGSAAVRAALGSLRRSAEGPARSAEEGGKGTSGRCCQRSGLCPALGALSGGETRPLGFTRRCPCRSPLPQRSRWQNCRRKSSTRLRV